MNEMRQHEERFSSIELLDFAKNHIVKAKQLEVNLPEKYKTLLDIIYHLLSFIQEYLYEY